MTDLIERLQRYVTGDDEDSPASSPDSSPERGTESGAAAAATAATPVAADPAAAGSAAGSDPDPAAEFDVPDRPSDSYHKLGISPESLLCELVRAHGGWIWQSDLVSETEWSASSVSRYLSSMEEEGVIARASAGRTNVVGFPHVLDSQAAEHAQQAQSA